MRCSGLEAPCWPGWVQILTGWDWGQVDREGDSRHHCFRSGYQTCHLTEGRETTHPSWGAMSSTLGVCRSLRRGFETLMVLEHLARELSGGREKAGKLPTPGQSSQMEPWLRGTLGGPELVPSQNKQETPLFLADSPWGPNLAPEATALALRVH